MTNLKNLLLLGGLAGSLAFSGCGNKKIDGEVMGPCEISGGRAYIIKCNEKKVFANEIPRFPLYKGDSIQISKYSRIGDFNYWEQDSNQGELKSGLWIDIEKYKLLNKRKDIIELIEEDLGINSKKEKTP